MPAKSYVLRTMADLPAKVQEGDLVLFDIDETLVRSEPDATEPWFNAFCGVLKQEDVSNVFMAGVELWMGLQAVCVCAAPEEDATRRALAAVAATSGVLCVGLTARGPECHGETMAQLRTCGVYDGIFDASSSLGVIAPPLPTDTISPLTHLGGIIYCSGSRKPAGLFAFDEHTAHSTGRRIVFVDDRESHVEALRAACAERGRDFVGLHYAPEGSLHAGSSATLARGWQLLAKVLGSEEGRAKMRRMLDLLSGEVEGSGGLKGARKKTPSSLLCASLGVVVGAGVALAAVRWRSSS